MENNMTKGEEKHNLRVIATIPDIALSTHCW